MAARPRASPRSAAAPPAPELQPDVSSIRRALDGFPGALRSMVVGGQMPVRAAIGTRGTFTDLIGVDEATGPSIVEEVSATTLVHLGRRLAVDQAGVVGIRPSEPGWRHARGAVAAR